MSEAESRSESSETLRQRVQAELLRLQNEDRERRKVVQILKSCAAAHTLDNLPRLRSVVKALRDLGPEGQARLHITELCRDLDHWVGEKSQRFRADLGRQLRETFTARGLPFRVVSREDPVEVRIPPLALRIDFGRGKAV